MKVKAEYISRAITVIIPSFLIIAAIIVVPYLNYKYIDIDSFVLKLLINIGGFAVFIYIVIKVNPLFVKAARKIRGTLSLKGSILSWSYMFRNGSVDLSQNHVVGLHSGHGIKASQGTMMVISNDGNNINICLPKMERYEAVGIFENEDFMGADFMPPEEGTGGFNLFPQKGEHHSFFTTLLKLAWEKKEINQGYENFKLFPWDRKPEPDVQDTRLITDEAEIAGYKEKAPITVGPNIFVLPDYVLAHNVSREEYYLFPLGHSSVIIAPRSGIIGGTTGGVSHYDVLECQGQDNTGAEIKIDVAKQIEGDDFYKEFYLMRYWDKTNTM
ncbi:MAG: hypothetical protein GY754_21720 [bacterium]|nr:hypothetical protein [bacterium]